MRGPIIVEGVILLAWGLTGDLTLRPLCAAPLTVVVCVWHWEPIVYIWPLVIVRGVSAIICIDLVLWWPSEVVSIIRWPIEAVAYCIDDDIIGQSSWWRYCDVTVVGLPILYLCIVVMASGIVGIVYCLLFIVIDGVTVWYLLLGNHCWWEHYLVNLWYL